mgnify:CR=1 FL=1
MRGVTEGVASHLVGDGFQPALPMRGVTESRIVPSPFLRISTRTPHAGSDLGGRA